MIKRIISVIAVLALVTICSASAQEKVRAWEGTLDLPTYLLDPAEVAPIFDRDWSYQRARRSVYPYALNDNMTRNREVVTYQALYLENEYVKLCVLPAIGGRLFYAIDKTNGYEAERHSNCTISYDSFGGDSNVNFPITVYYSNDWEGSGAPGTGKVDKLTADFAFTPDVSV